MSEYIRNYSVYTDEMRKSMVDKIDFLDEIKDVDTIVDYGCADGVLLDLVSEKRPTLKYIGIDNNAEMIRLAKQKLPFVDFVEASVPTTKAIQTRGKKMLVISSVFHEVYSYCDAETIENVWITIGKENYQYVAIRDMICPEEQIEIAQSDIERIRNKQDVSERLQEFEEEWGSISNHVNFLHFLLKYRYIYNWKREVKENYLGFKKSVLEQKMADMGYRPVYKKIFTLPFIHDRIKEDFGIDLNIPTHIKVIYEKI